LPVVPTCRTPARLPRDGETPHVSRHPAPEKRGVSRSSRTSGVGCDGREGRKRRMRSSRTAKSCGSDIPTLISSWRRCLRILPATVAKKPVHRGEHGISRKTIAQGMPDPFGEPVVTLLACFFISHARLRVHRAPGIPCALSAQTPRVCRDQKGRETKSLVRIRSGNAKPCRRECALFDI